MNYKINSTIDYHVKKMNTLGWELTVCNALYPENTPIRKIMSRNDSFGHLLYDHLSGYIPMENIQTVIEIGGGYGYLMKDFIDRNDTLKPTMLDISPFLLKKQSETLSGYNAKFIEEDFLETSPAFLAGFDLAIMNENLGDFPTLVDVSKALLQPPSRNAVDPQIERVVNLFEKYGLGLPERKSFNVNIGALYAVEKLCASGIPYIYLGEHSCEAKSPEAFKPFIRVESSGNPERIPLKGHDEYTIKFSYIERVAQALGYEAIRGYFIDFLKVNFTEDLCLILASQGRFSDEGEIICQFVEDLFKYEYLILSQIKNKTA